MKSAYFATTFPVARIQKTIEINRFGQQDLNIDMDSPLGSGNFSTVYSALLKGQKKVAFKLLNDSDDVYSEALIMVPLDHPNIVRMFGYVGETPQCGLVLELLTNGSLSKYLLNEKIKPVDLVTRGNIAKGIVNGLLYLHNIMKIIHFDINANNILLDQSLQAKISDFGLAVQGETYKSKEYPGALRYIGPEAFELTDDAVIYTQKIDIYTLALTLYLLLVNFQEHRLLENQTDETVMEYHKSGIVDVLKLNTDAPVEKLLIYCLHKNPKDRPDIEEIRERLNLVLTK